MAERLFGLEGRDVPRVKRVLDASESGQYNTQDPAGRRRFQSPVPFEFGFTDSSISAGSSGQISLFTTTGDTGKNESAISLRTVNTTANTKVKVWRHQRSRKLHFDTLSEAAAAGSTPFRFGYLSTGSTGYDPQGVALVNLYTTTGLIPNSTVSAINLSADRIDKVLGSPSVWAPQKVAVHTHVPSGDLYFERVPTVRRFFVASMPGVNASHQDYLPIRSTTTFNATNTTGFGLANTTGSTFGGFDTLILKDPGDYRVDFSYSVAPTQTSDFRVEALVGPVTGPADSAFGAGQARTHLITSSTTIGARYQSTAERIRMTGFSFGHATTANTLLRMQFSEGLSGSAIVNVSLGDLLITATVYV